MRNAQHHFFTYHCKVIFLIVIVCLVIRCMLSPECVISLWNRNKSNDCFPFIVVIQFNQRFLMKCIRHSNGCHCLIFKVHGVVFFLNKTYIWNNTYKTICFRDFKRFLYWFWSKLLEKQLECIDLLNIFLQSLHYSVEIFEYRQLLYRWSTSQWFSLDKFFFWELLSIYSQKVSLN